MQAQTKDAAQVAVVVAHDFVGLEVPAFHFLVERAAEEVGVAVGDGEARDLLDVTGQREAELARGEVLEVVVFFFRKGEEKIEFFFLSLLDVDDGDEEKKRGKKKKKA